MNKLKLATTLSGLILFATTTLTNPVVLIAQGDDEGGGTIGIVGGEELAKCCGDPLPIEDAVGRLTNGLWIISTLDEPVELQLRAFVMAGPWEGWIDDESKPFKLESSDEKAVPYDGKYGIGMPRVLSAKRLLQLTTEAGLDPELSIEMSAPKVVAPIPCCPPIDKELVIKVLGPTDLVGEDGVVRDGHVLLFLVARPVDGTYGDAKQAPGFGDRRKVELQGLAIPLRVRNNRE